MEKEWEKEPDIKKFKYKGYKCEIRRHPEMKSLNGYVEVPQTHPKWGKHYSEIDIHCHGGLTYSYTDKLIHTIGFDCAHLNDLIPGMLEMGMGFESDVYKNISYVKKELMKIVDQLEVMNNV
ncbi:MAG: hypothetical protein RR585_04500 [Coprobacillus sp.]